MSRRVGGAQYPYDDHEDIDIRAGLKQSIGTRVAPENASKLLQAYGIGQPLYKSRAIVVQVATAGS